MKTLLAAPAALLMIALQASVSLAASATLVLGGTGSSIGAMQRMTEAYSRKYPEVTFRILPSMGSAGGIKAVKSGKVDIGLTSRPLKPEEVAPGLVDLPYGRTPFVFVAHPGTRQASLSLNEIEKIYAGQQTAWQDGSPLRLVLRPKTDAYTLYLQSISERLKAASQKSFSTPGLFTGVTDQDSAHHIERTAGSFGTTSLSLVMAERSTVKAMAVDGVMPSVASLESGKYPYAMTMHFTYIQQNPMVEKFLDFVFSREGQKILRETGHLPLKRVSTH